MSDVPSPGLRWGPGRGRCWGHPGMPRGGSRCSEGWQHPLHAQTEAKGPWGAGRGVSEPPFAVLEEKEPLQAGVRTASPGRVCGRAGTVQSRQGGFAPGSVQHRDTGAGAGGRMSRALSSCPRCGQALFQPFRPSVSSRGAPAPGRWWHPDTRSPTFGWSRPLLTETKGWQRCGACVGAASPQFHSVGWAAGSQVLSPSPPPPWCSPAVGPAPSPDPTTAAPVLSVPIPALPFACGFGGKQLDFRASEGSRR